MLYHLQDLHFSSHSVDIGFISNPGLFKNFDSNLVASLHVHPKSHSAKGTFAKSFPQHVTAYLVVIRLNGLLLQQVVRLRLAPLRKIRF